MRIYLVTDDAIVEILSVVGRLNSGRTIQHRRTRNRVRLEAVIRYASIIDVDEDTAITSQFTFR